MNTSDIDRTHIIALKEENGMLRNVELRISRPEQFIAELSAMVDNPNRTVWDMQSHFANRFPKSAMCLDYLHPFSYQSAYVGATPYPSFKDYEELRQSWAKVGSDARETYLNECRRSGITQNLNEALRLETNAVANKKWSQKYYFHDEAMRWINASCYSEEALRLNKDSSVKMFSKENVGWSDFNHKVNDDIKIAIRTNFGFGRAAHFVLAVQYKGLDILPYSYIVKYYNAGMADIVRCTRSYHPCRESWVASFDFISDFVNQSVANPETFVRSYILEEVKEMIAGLEKIAENPKGFIDKIAQRTPDHCIINVRNMLDSEKERMKVNPEETTILFKVEKIVGALDFLKSLTEIAQEVKEVQEYIDRLLELNMALYPEVSSAADKVRTRIGEQTLIKEGIESKILVISEKLRPIEEDINQLSSKATPDNPFSLQNYKTTHPMYTSLLADKSELQKELYKVNTLISDYNSFLSLLNKSINRIDEVMQLQKAA